MLDTYWTILSGSAILLLPYSRPGRQRAASLSWLSRHCFVCFVVQGPALRPRTTGKKGTKKRIEPVASVSYCIRASRMTPSSSNLDAYVSEKHQFSFTRLNKGRAFFAGRSPVVATRTFSIGSPIRAHESRTSLPPEITVLASLTRSPNRSIGPEFIC